MICGSCNRPSWRGSAGSDSIDEKLEVRDKVSGPAKTSFCALLKLFRMVGKRSKAAPVPVVNPGTSSVIVIRWLGLDASARKARVESSSGSRIPSHPPRLRPSKGIIDVNEPATFIEEKLLTSCCWRSASPPFPKKAAALRSLARSGGSSLAGPVPGSPPSPRPMACLPEVVGMLMSSSGVGREGGVSDKLMRMSSDSAMGSISRVVGAVAGGSMNSPTSAGSERTKSLIGASAVGAAAAVGSSIWSVSRSMYSLPSMRELASKISSPRRMSAGSDDDSSRIMLRSLVVVKTATEDISEKEEYACSSSAAASRSKTGSAKASASCSRNAISYSSSTSVGASTTDESARSDSGDSSSSFNPLLSGSSPSFRSTTGMPSSASQCCGCPIRCLECTSMPLCPSAVAS